MAVCHVTCSLCVGEPEIRQVTVPAAGARLILASDGLWDAVVAKTIIHKASHSSSHMPRRLCTMAGRTLTKPWHMCVSVND